MALLGCAQRLEGLKAAGRDISVCSDSEVTLRALATQATRSWLVGECKEMLGRVAERNRLHLLWVPGHIGIRGNEIADRLFLSLSTRLEITGPELFVGIARCWARSTIKKWVSENHSRWSVAISRGNHVKELLGPGEKQNWTEFIYSSKRREARSLVQIRQAMGS